MIKAIPALEFIVEICAYFPNTYSISSINEELDIMAYQSIVNRLMLFLEIYNKSLDDLFFRISK